MSDSEYQPSLLRYVFDPFKGVKISDDDMKSEALQEAADYARESMLSMIGDGKSPVKGHGSFHKLSKAYAELKSHESGSPLPNLELTGDMLNALQVNVTDDGLLEVMIEGDQAEKADGHCQLTGRDSPLPQRRFIPGSSESLAEPIIKGMGQIARKYADKATTRNEEIFRRAISYMTGQDTQITFADLGLLDE